MYHLYQTLTMSLEHVECIYRVECFLKYDSLTIRYELYSKTLNRTPCYIVLCFRVKRLPPFLANVIIGVVCTCID